MDKILIITYYWPPSGGAGVQRWLKFTRYLPEFGFEPLVLTVDPRLASYAQTDESLELEVSPGLRVFRTRTFEFYNLYKLISGKKEIPYGGFANSGKVTPLQKLSRTLRGNLFLPDPRRGWNRYAVAMAVRLIKKHGISTVITTSPPHSTQLIGLKLKRRLGIRWIADLRDPWTDIYYYNELHHTALAAAADRRMERKVLEGADGIITVSADLKRLFTEKLPPGGGDKIAVIPNGYDEADFRQQVAPEASGRFVITYTGTISESYDLSGFLEAIAGLPPALRQRIVLRFVGRVPAAVMQQTGSLPDLATEQMGYVDHLQSIAFLMRSSLQLLVIPKVENNKGIVTGKFFEYLASEKPVLAIGPRGGDLEGLISETGCGRLFGYGEAEGMRDWIASLAGGEAEATAPMNAGAYSRRALTGRLVALLTTKSVAQ